MFHRRAVAPQPPPQPPQPPTVIVAVRKPGNRLACPECAEAGLARTFASASRFRDHWYFAHAHHPTESTEEKDSKCQ